MERWRWGWGEDRQELTILEEMEPGEYLKQQEWVGVGVGAVHEFTL